MASNHLPNWTRTDGTPLVPQAAPVKAATETYNDPRYLNGTQKVQ